MIKSRLQQGFTLVEIAIVLLIVSILLGYTVAMFPVQQELKQYRKAASEMDDILEHLIGFAQINNRLPCPDTNGDVNGTGTFGDINGQEDIEDQVDNVTGVGPPDGLAENCKGFYGFLPAGTLGMNGNFDAQGRLLDPWGLPYRYHVSDFDASGTLPIFIDLVTPDGIGVEGLSNVLPDLFVCDDSDNSSATDLTCAAVSANPIIGNAAVVIYSSGKDRGVIASNIQDENQDDFQDGTNDKVYASSTRNDSAGNEYDDIVRWISPNVLYSKMIEADQLP